MLCTALDRIVLFDIFRMETQATDGNIKLSNPEETEANLKKLLGEDEYLGELTTYEKVEETIAALVKAAGYRKRTTKEMKKGKIGLKRITTGKKIRLDGIGKKTDRSVFLKVNVAKFSTEALEA